MGFVYDLKTAFVVPSLEQEGSSQKLFRAAPGFVARTNSVKIALGIRKIIKAGPEDYRIQLW